DRCLGRRSSIASRRRPIARSSFWIALMSSCVAGRASSSAWLTRSRTLVADCSAPRTISSIVCCARVRASLARRALASWAWRACPSGAGAGSGTAWVGGVVVGGRRPIGAAPSHIVTAITGTTGQPPLHLRPHAELADRVLLPGDPHRALAVAQAEL